MGLPGARHNYAMRFALAIAASVLGACTLAASAPAALTVEPPVRLDRSSSGSPQLSDAFINYSVMAWRNANSVKVARWFKGTGPTTRTLATNAVSGQTIAVSAGSSRAVVAWRTKSGLRFAMSGKEGVFGSRSIAIPGSSRGTSVAITWPSYSRWTSSGGSVVISWVAPTGCGTAAKAISYNPIRRSFDGPLRTLSPKCGHAAMLRASSHAIAWRSGTSKGGYSIVARAVGSTGTIGRLRTVSRHRVVGFAPSVADTYQGAMIAWRDRASGDVRGSKGKVMIGEVLRNGRETSVKPISFSDRIVGRPTLASNGNDFVLATWQQGGLSPVVMQAAGQSLLGFSDPQVISRCGAYDATGSNPAAAISNRSNATVFQTACMGELGGSSDYGAALVTQRAGNAWDPAVALSSAGYARNPAIVASWDGYLATWVQDGSRGGLMASRITGE